MVWGTLRKLFTKPSEQVDAPSGMKLQLREGFDIGIIYWICYIIFTSELQKFKQFKQIKCQSIKLQYTEQDYNLPFDFLPDESMDGHYCAQACFAVNNKGDNSKCEVTTLNLWLM